MCTAFQFVSSTSWREPCLIQSQESWGCAGKPASMVTMLCSSMKLRNSLVIKQFIPELFKAMHVPGCEHIVCVCSPPIPSPTHTKPLLPSWQRNGSVTDIRPASLTYVFLSVAILSVKGENMPLKSLAYGATAVRHKTKKKNRGMNPKTKLGYIIDFNFMSSI